MGVTQQTVGRILSQKVLLGVLAKDELKLYNVWNTAKHKH